MLPGNVLSSPSEPAAFLPPKDRAKTSLADYFLGGRNIGDTSTGLNSQVWEAVTADGFTISYYSPITAFIPVVTAAAALVWLSAAFDQSLRPLVAWTDATGSSYYYWYDSSIPGYRTTLLPAGTITPYATLDDARVNESNSNDGLITYINAAGNLVYRQQRDRFATDYVLGTVPPVSPTFGPALLTQVGLNVDYRMQYQFQYPALGVTAWPPVLLSNLVGAIPRVWPVQDDITAYSRTSRNHR